MIRNVDLLTVRHYIRRMNGDDIKNAVRERYGRIAASRSGDDCYGAGETTQSCCGQPSDPSATNEYSMIGDAYDTVEGHEADADLGLGCGIPTQHAQLRPGETVVDLGSGAGNDAFVARYHVGDSGRVIGLDMTAEMVERARSIARARGYLNVEFVLGEIESMPIDSRTAEIVVSNCTLNLVPDKEQAFAEMFRIIKPGGRFCVSDIVTTGQLPPEVRHSAEAYVGCIAGALERDTYLRLLAGAGFVDIQLQAEREIPLPPDLARPVTAAGARVLSITVGGRRPD